MNNYTLNDLTAKEWLTYTRSWFILTPKTRKKLEKLHPAKYPEELVGRFVTFFTKKGEWVLDPFMGIGSTLVESRRLRRNVTGIDINPRFCEIANQRLSQRTFYDHELHTDVILGDSRKLPYVLNDYYKSKIPRYALSISSPPYYNMLRKSRGGSNSTHKERKKEGLDVDFGEIDGNIELVEKYEDFLESVCAVYRQLYFFLKDKGYLVIIAQNFRDEDGRMKCLAWDIARQLSYQYVLQQEQIWCQRDKQMGIWGYPSTYVSNTHHHYVLIFRKEEKDA